jgi:hypothetical protein
MEQKKKLNKKQERKKKKQLQKAAENEEKLQRYTQHDTKKSEMVVHTRAAQAPTYTCLCTTTQ